MVSTASAAAGPGAPSSDPAAPSASASAPGARISIWDNARFTLIVLVVVAHVISSVRMQTPLGFGVYVFIYLFHMPAMIALSGLFSKADTSPRVVRSTLQLLITWVCWEVIWALIHFFSSGTGPSATWLVVPAWTLWFLVALVTMRILLPYIARLRHPLLFSTALALLAGLSPAIGTEFSASRTLVFTPFFVAAWLANNRGWLQGEWFMKPRTSTRIAAAATLIAIGVAVALLALVRREWRIDTWLLHRDDYVWLFGHAPVFGWAPSDWWTSSLGGAGVRFGLMLIAAIMTFALLVLVPRGRGLFTVWGTRTLFVYLLHGPIVMAMRVTGAAEWFGEFGAAGLVALVAIGIAITFVLSMSWVTKVFRPVIEPRFDWLFARK